MTKNQCVTKNRSYVNWLNHVPGLGRKKLSVILSANDQNPEQIYRMNEELMKKYFMDKCEFSERVSETLARNITATKKTLSLERLDELMLKKEISILLPGDRGYPKRIVNIPDAPIALYMCGDMETVCEIAGNKVTGSTPVLAVVGARGCSEYGKIVAVQIGRKCADYGVAVVSGLATGVDGLAQWSALQSEGMVAAVLGCGVDICYPASNRKIYDELRRNGCILSEYIPGTEPRANNFPPRNRIISGMADAVIVVEAKEKSGTLITVDMALEQGREVYIIPGRITDPMSRGCNQLIRQGASIICDIDEMFDEILEKESTFSVISEVSEIKEDIKMNNPYPEGEIRHEIYKALDIESKSIQKIFEELHGAIDIRTIQTELLFMKMEGNAKECDGRYGAK